MIRMMHAMTDDGDDADGDDDDDDGDDNDCHHDDDDHDRMMHEQLLGLRARFRTVGAGGAPRVRYFRLPCAVMGPHCYASGQCSITLHTSRRRPTQWMAVGPSMLLDAQRTCALTDKRNI